MTDKVNIKLMSMFDLYADKTGKINSYQAKKELQNKKFLEDYSVLNSNYIVLGIQYYLS